MKNIFHRFCGDLCLKDSRCCYYGFMCIVIIASLLRVLSLGSMPNGFYCDEASQGYDAYSILMTGRDRSGQAFPLFVKSFDYYPEALLTYTAIIPVSIFGLNEFAVRLPSAIVGILTVIALFFLTKEIFDAKVALLAALLLSISPWHMVFSRMAWPAIFISFFVCWGLYFLIKACHQKPNYFILSGVCFAFCLWTYPAARVFTPLFLIGLGINYFQEFKQYKKQTFIASFIIVAVFVPLFLFWISPQGMTRAHATLNKSLWQSLGNYFSYFSPRFLFFEGDKNLRHSLLGTGQLYLFELITVCAGIMGILINRSRKKEYQMLFIWLILYPIPAALTEPGHALRSLVGAPLFAILSASGIFVLADFLKQQKVKRLYFVTMALILVVSAGVFLKVYFLDYSQYGVRAWQYGMKEAVQYAENSQYKNIFMSHKFNKGYIFALFYTKFPPKEYQLAARNGQRYSFGKYQVEDLSKVKKFPNSSLLILKAKDSQEIISRFNGKVVHVIRDPMGKELIKLIRVDQERNSNFLSGLF